MMNSHAPVSSRMLAMKFSFGHRTAFGFGRVKAAVARSLRVLSMGVLAVVSMHALEWQHGAVLETIGGRLPSFQIDKYGNVHACSSSPTNSVLSYSFWDHAVNKWFSTVLDQSSGFCSLALDSQQRPHISYIGYGTGKLKYAHWNGASWDKQEIAIQATRVISYNSSIALDSEDLPIISCYEEGVRLRVVRWNGKYWEVRTADSDEESGKFNSLGIDSQGRPQIAFANVKYRSASLRFVRWNGKSWDEDYIEGAVGQPAIMYSVMMALDKADVPHIAYSDVQNGLIKYAVKRGPNWEKQVVGVVAKVGYPDRNGIAVDEQGGVYISFYDAGSGILKLAYKKGQKWVNEIVDEQYAGFTSCLRIAGGSIWLMYSDDSGEQLQYARAVLPQPSGEVKLGSGYSIPATGQSREMMRSKQ
jgi:hypothetical protein